MLTWLLLGYVNSLRHLSSRMREKKRYDDDENIYFFISFCSWRGWMLSHRFPSFSPSPRRILDKRQTFRNECRSVCVSQGLCHLYSFQPCATMNECVGWCWSSHSRAYRPAAAPFFLFLHILLLTRTPTKTDREIKIFFSLFLSSTKCSHHSSLGSWCGDVLSLTKSSFRPFSHPRNQQINIWEKRLHNTTWQQHFPMPVPSK